MMTIAMTESCEFAGALRNQFGEAPFTTTSTSKYRSWCTSSHSRTSRWPITAHRRMTASRSYRLSQPAPGLEASSPPTRAHRQIRPARTSWRTTVCTKSNVRRWSSAGKESESTRCGADWQRPGRTNASTPRASGTAVWSEQPVRTGMHPSRQRRSTRGRGRV
jgi:hypothetical protein